MKKKLVPRPKKRLIRKKPAINLSTARKGRGRPGGRGRAVHHKLIVRSESLGQATESKIRVPSGRPDTRARMIKAVGTPSNYQTTNQFVISGTNPGQQVYSSFPFATQSALQNINTFIGNANGVTFNQPARFLLENVHLTYEFQNLSSAPATLRIYVLRPKRDTWSTPEGNAYSMTFLSASGLNYPWSGYPENAIQQGYNAQVSAASGSLNYLNPSVAPTTVNLFNQYYKIDKEIEVEMSQGGVHRFELNRHYDKMCDGSVYGDTPINNLMGLTGIILFRLQGSPVHDITNDSMTLSIPKVGVVTQTQYRFTQVFSPIIASKDANALQQTSTDVLQQVNPGSGAVATVVNA